MSRKLCLTDKDVMETVITKPRHSIGLWTDLEQIAPRAAAILGCSIDELHLLDGDTLNSDHMDLISRDRVIKEEGPLATLPFIQNKGRNKPIRSYGYGLVLYQQQGTNIRYAFYSSPSQYDDNTYVFIPKQKLYVYERHVKKLIKNNCADRQPPILSPGVLEDVIRNTIGFLSKAREIEAFGVRIKRGLILDGPPGNGKTMLCRYLQKLCIDSNISWGIITSSEIDSAYNNQRLDSLFRRYTVSFFDDIDISYLNRNNGQGKIACSLLSAMDGIDNDNHLVRIFTTNENISDLDEAFTRPGRIDRTITLNRPTADLRRKLVQKAWPKVIQENINVDKLISKTDECSFAEMECIRGFLVANYVLGQKEWDLDLALQQYKDRQSDGVKSMGFGLSSEKPSYAEPWGDDDF